MSNGTHNNQVIPTIPGLIVERQYQKHLQGVVANLLQSTNSHRFLGAQPVSFAAEHIQSLKEQDYFVCEKSDGIRCLIFMRYSEQGYPETFLIDRKNDFRILQDFYFPSLNPHSRYHNDTIIDGELVVDTYEDGTTKLNYLCFDALIVESKLLIERPFSKRQGYLRQNVINPLDHLLNRHPELKRKHPFGVLCKSMLPGYAIDYILNYEANQLGHKSDGLIFTSVEAPYVLGTCDTMLKWKPPSENSVDFRLNLESQGPTLKPKFLLSIWTGGSSYQYSSEMGVTDEEWIRFKRMPNLEGCIVEVVYDPDHCPPHKWKFLRFREDKLNANHISVLEKILKSIDDNIDTEMLLNEAVEIKTLWKKRPHPLFQ